jgi:uncharacterized protein (TIGR03437 family)
LKRSLSVLLAALAFAMVMRQTMAQSTDPVWVPGSTQKVCQPNGQSDYETGLATVSQTQTNYGLIGNDLGSSFLHNGKLWILFGDTSPTNTFNGKPNSQTDPPRIAADNDSIAFTSSTDISQCLTLNFVKDSIGAYQNPVVLNAQGTPAITLGTNEVPQAGIDVGGSVYVVFATDNNNLTPVTGNLGNSTRSVMAVSSDDGNTYHYLYDLSAPPCVRCDGAKFVFVAMANGEGDGFVYFWGAAGGTGYRNSTVYVARKLATGMGQASGMQYLTGLAADGTPNWSASEASAVGLFQDASGANSTPANCTGEVGVEYNTFVQRWVMLYNCQDRTPQNLNGIYMRFAQQPWGPWGAPQTIFNGQRDRGDCFFIHRAVTVTSPACDQLSGAARLDVAGGAYGPFFLTGFTTGAAATGTSTFYYMLSTWNPYIEVIMQTTIQSVSQTMPVIGLVANAEGESATIAPNTWLEIKGSNLAKPGSGRIWLPSDFVGNQMPTALDGVSVTVNGKPAYVYYISPTQVNVLTPPDAIAGPVHVVLTYNGNNASFTAPAQSTSPSFFIFDTLGDVAATHVNGIILGPTAPAKPGETVVLYANGFGPTTVPVTSGSSTQTGTLSPLPPIHIGGIPATVTFAGLVAPGEYQFNVVVPLTTPDGNQPVAATLNGIPTQSNAMIAVHH